MMLNKLDGANDGESAANGMRPGRNSLKDRFKLLRMREEAGITTIGEEEGGKPGAFAGFIGRTASYGFGLASPTAALHDEKDGDQPGHPLASPHPPSSPNPATVNHALAPGTASGISAGPSAFADPASAVDWDLWQSVVYEGPAAVARTSAEELNRAIATGIPSAIRGVVWQVLAQSKNEELESVYRDLVSRGTDKDKDRKSSPTRSSVQTINMREKEHTTSSASSVHSEGSTPATTTNGMTSPSPSHEKDAETLAKQQVAATAARKKQAKEDAAALQKLERSIRRDLGARTSFSKFASSAGLQEGLFGVCKAYALFDEGVGYAQGMNFLAMPLLFNVGTPTTTSTPNANRHRCPKKRPSVSWSAS